MPDFLSRPCTAFAGTRRIARGPLLEVALALRAEAAATPDLGLLTFDDATGAVVDLDLRGDPAEIAARLAERAKRADPPAGPHRPEAPEGAARGRGRPRLGVVAREVTLLPRHWTWLATQPGGASQALRRLVDGARRADGGRTQARQAQAAAYRFMSAMAGDLPGFEEAVRALFAGDADRLAIEMADWPDDVRAYARKLAAGTGTADGHD